MDWDTHHNKILLDLILHPPVRIIFRIMPIRKILSSINVNRYYRYRANHAGISYNVVGMTRARYERINNRSDYTVLHDT